MVLKKPFVALKQFPFRMKTKEKCNFDREFVVYKICNGTKACLSFIAIQNRQFWRLFTGCFSGESNLVMNG